MCLSGGYCARAVVSQSGDPKGPEIGGKWLLIMVSVQESLAIPRWSVGLSSW